MADHTKFRPRHTQAATLRLSGLGLLAGCCMACFSATARGGEPAPVARWGFGQEEATPLQAHGGVHRDVPGPRPDAYPDFPVDNIAVRLDGQGARYTLADPGSSSPYDFTNGDEITLEGWVKIDDINEGDNVYVIGKGRTGDARFGSDNQNWALRLRRVQGRVCTSFLFAAVVPSETTKTRQVTWHRWTSDRGFAPGTQWHHVAIAYRFGDPQSLLSVIDGKQVTGTWDAEGPTKYPPVVDDDAVWIGSALGGTPSNSFRGDLDEIAIYRQALPLDVLSTRYRGPNLTLAEDRAAEEMPNLGEIPPGQVQLTFHEGMPSHARWLNVGEALPKETLRWQTEAFLIDQLPQRFDAWGIRDNWKGPVLVRMAADVPLTAGKHRFLMRARGLSRLWVDGKLVARGTKQTPAQDGFESMTPPALPPKPGLRIAEHRQQELIGVCDITSAGSCRVVLEMLVGGKDFRTDPGETLVALEDSQGESYLLLTAADHQQRRLTDDVIDSLLKQQSAALKQFDDHRRRTAAASQDAYWKQRHDLAREWAATHPVPVVPGKGGQHPIDAFLQAKRESALAASSPAALDDSRQFHKEILPILRDHCFRCHGEKSRGGLRLDTLERARAGGDSGLPAVVPGDAHKSELLSRIRSTSPEERMPPGGSALTPELITRLEDWIRSGAVWPAFPVTPEMVALPEVIADEAFLRRVYLDTVGVIPTADEVRGFLNDPAPKKRERMIQQLLADERWADHWSSYWMDVLAENPTLINASLNTTGPFRWFIYDSFRDDKPLDRFVTELILLRGSAHEGGSAGFGIASNNDSAFAAKGQIVAGAFLGIELQCARCHDSPYHETRQRDLYALAAMFERKSVSVPSSSRVPAAFFEKQERTSLIQVTLKPGESVPPAWPFAEVTGCTDDDSLAALLRNPQDSREKLAALITSPRNHRFAEVMVNRLWKRLMGTGIIDSADDWEAKTPTHPELLRWLAHELITHDYNLKHVARLVLTSDVYQRTATRETIPVVAELQFFVAPTRRRMTAEQLVDSLMVAVGKPLDVEEMTFAPEAGTGSDRRLTLGQADRAWKLTSLGNERDRPSLSLPKARALADILEAFGWNGARQNPRTDRESASNVLQPGILQNGDAAVLLSRASVHSGLAEAAVEAESPEALVDTLFLRILNRFPRAEEREALAALLSQGFAQRLLPESEWVTPPAVAPLAVITWSNHVQPEANIVALQMEERARTGPPADPRLRSEWREVYEDIVWSLLNLSEFVWIP